MKWIDEEKKKDQELSTHSISQSLQWIMNKIIALNWKNTQTLENAQDLLKTAKIISQNFPQYQWVIFPGDHLINKISTNIALWLENINTRSSIPYCLIWHMSQRIAGKDNNQIQTEIESLIETKIIPFFCIGPIHREDTLEQVIIHQLSALRNWPKDREIVVCYEPMYSIWNGQSMSLEDIEIMIDILRHTLCDFTKINLLYGGSVNEKNIAWILKITDGVIIGTASQKDSALFSIWIALSKEIE